MKLEKSSVLTTDEFRTAVENTMATFYNDHTRLAKMGSMNSAMGSASAYLLLKHLLAEYGVCEHLAAAVAQLQSGSRK